MTLQDNGHGLRFYMRPLPRPEYWLLKQFKRTYGIDDDRDAFVMLLALMHSVSRLEHGHQWIVDVINQVVQRSEEERRYEWPS